LSVKNIRLLIYLFLFIFISLFYSCADRPNEPEMPSERWKIISAFGEEDITQLYVKSDNSQLSVTSENYFGRIMPGSNEPDILVELESSTHDCYNYIPFFNDDLYFYSNVNGQYLYVGENSSGELIGTIPIGSIVDSINSPAQFTRSQGYYHSNHIEFNNGLYMISIRHLNIAQDDWLYFGEFDISDNEISFILNKKIRAYEELGTASAWVNSNYYYGGYFWQYRSDSFNPSVCAVNERDNSIIYTEFGSIIRSVFEYYDYALGLFDGPIKKSYDGGFTWENWINMNAPWNHIIIDGIHMFFFSHNLASIDFETLEIENYDSGELYGHCIVSMAQFDGKVFAATRDGLYYCHLEDFIIIEPEEVNTRAEGKKLQITGEF